MTRVVSFACVCARVRVRARQEITWRCSRTHMTEPEPWQAAEINEGTVRTNFFKSNFTRPCLDVFPFYARVLPRTPRWNVLNETLFIYLFIFWMSSLTNENFLGTWWSRNEDLTRKPLWKTSRFVFVIFKRMNRFRNYVTIFRGRFCFVLFIFVLFFSSPPPPATWNTAICPGGPGPIDDFIFYLFTKSLTALKMSWSWSWRLLFFHVLFNRNALENKSYGGEWAVP